jgi:hypothetical protein
MTQDVDDQVTRHAEEPGAYRDTTVFKGGGTFERAGKDLVMQVEGQLRITQAPQDGRIEPTSVGGV